MERSHENERGHNYNSPSTCDGIRDQVPAYPKKPSKLRPSVLRVSPGFLFLTCCPLC